MKKNNMYSYISINFSYKHTRCPCTLLRHSSRQKNQFQTQRKKNNQSLCLHAYKYVI